MVTIVKKEPHASVVKECICKNCGVTLSYVPADVTSTVHRDYTGGADTVKSITCPNCSATVHVD